MKRDILVFIEYLLTYIKEKRQIDKEFLEGLIALTIKEKNLEGFFHELIISSKSSSPTKKTNLTLGDYGLTSHDITFYMNVFNDLIAYLSKSLKLRPQEQLCLPYLISTQNMFHELNHAEQCKLEGTRYDLEDTLLIATSTNFQNAYLMARIHDSIPSSKEEEYCHRLVNNYKVNYKFSPKERLAEHYAIIKMLSIIEGLPIPDLKHLRCYFSYLRYQNYLRGYDETLSPTNFYLNTIMANQVWPELEWLIEDSKDLSLSNRLKLGLGITREEYESVLAKRNVLARRICK